MLRKHGYTEWDGTSGNILAAGYDWRLHPAKMEERDQVMTKTMERVEAMVAANGGTPAVVVGFSLGCKVGKYFLHFCHATKGDCPPGPTACLLHVTYLYLARPCGTDR